MELPPEVVLKEHHAGLDRELFVLVCKLTVHLSRPLLNPSVDQTDLFLRETKLFQISHRNQRHISTVPAGFSDLGFSDQTFRDFGRPIAPWV